ncbi:hypothetical protein ACSAZL_11415 [Methanosarcina sp. T3]|uniref:hypothetical protein n=1 Tax=Methanosarcina sp. T3 TaxID=3439062 RepID=UPI003F866A2C
MHEKANGKYVVSREYSGSINEEDGFSLLRVDWKQLSVQDIPKPKRGSLANLLQIQSQNFNTIPNLLSII